MMKKNKLKDLNFYGTQIRLNLKTLKEIVSIIPNKDNGIFTINHSNGTLYTKSIKNGGDGISIENLKFFGSNDFQFRIRYTNMCNLISDINDGHKNYIDIIKNEKLDPTSEIRSSFFIIIHYEDIIIPITVDKYSNEGFGFFLLRNNDDDIKSIFDDIRFELSNLHCILNDVFIV